MSQGYEVKCLGIALDIKLAWMGYVKKNERA